MTRIKSGQLRQWITTGRMLLIISPVSGCSNWMVLKHTGDIQIFSESVLEFITYLIND